MKVTLCSSGVCEVVKDCPEVDVRDDCVVIGEYDNICTLTHEQFNILKEKVKNGEI